MEWEVPHKYAIGDHVVWRGINLACTRDHYAGDAATHPWDPGAGWTPEVAATLWAPNGPLETEKLRAEMISCSDQPARLRAVLFEAIGG